MTLFRPDNLKTPASRSIPVHFLTSPSPCGLPIAIDPTVVHSTVVTLAYKQKLLFVSVYPSDHSRAGNFVGCDEHFVCVT